MTRILRRIYEANRPAALAALRASSIFLIASGACGSAGAQQLAPKLEPVPPPPACYQLDPVAFPATTPPTNPPRPSARRGYVEIVYNADSRELWWVDRAGITHRGNYSIKIENNSVFAPVTFAKERIIVTICNAKFNSEASTSVATTVIPESAPDIRGLAAQATAAPLGTTTVSNFALQAKTAETASPPKTADDYAQLAASYYERFERLRTELYALRCGPGPQPCAPPQLCAPPPPCIEGSPCVPRPSCDLDTIAAIQARADDLGARLPVPSGEPWPAGLWPLTDQAAFDSYAARTKSLVDNINNLAATLVAGDYLTRATGLAADYVALQAPLARDGATTDVIVTEALTAAASVNASNNTIPADPGRLCRYGSCFARSAPAGYGSGQLDKRVSRANGSPERR